MTFLAPLPALIAAAVAAPALLALYFLKLRRRPVRVGSTMLWRQTVEDLQANVPLRWIRPSLLLFLQLLALALLLMAMARPAIHTDGAMPEKVFIVLDRSASMRAADMPGGATRFEAARDLAGQAIERVTSGGARSEITVLAFAAEPEIIAGPTRSRAELERALAASEPTDQPGDLAAALRLVQALSAPEDEADTRRPLVVVCSDGAARGELPALAADVRFARAAPEAPGANLGIVALAARRDPDAPARVRLFARILSTLPEETTAPLAVLIDGEVVQRRALDIAPVTDEGPGETPIALDAQVPGEAVLTLRIEREDVLPSDDAAAVLIGAPRRPSVLLVRESEAEQAGAGWLLTDVLRELDLSALTLMSASRVQTLGAAAFEGVDLIVFDGVAPPLLPSIPSIHFGAPPETPALDPREGPGGVLPILSWDRNHPLLRDISLDAVRVGRTLLLEPGPEPAGFTELARTASGVVLAALRDGSITRVLSGFELVQSTWPVDYSFPIFLANAVETLPRTGGLAEGWAATTAAAALPPRPVEAGATLSGPDERTRVLSGGPEGGPVRSLGVLERAGLWRAGDVPIPVNLVSPSESALSAPEVLPVPGGAVAGGRNGDITGEPREVWPWFVLAAAALLALEWVLFGLRARVS